MSVATACLRAPAAPSGKRWRTWLSFLGQIGLVAAGEVSDDLLRGAIAEHDSATGIANAVRVINFEAVHGLWVEPAWQRFFEQTHHLLGMAFGWSQAVLVVNTIYTLGHVGVTFAFALWFYFWRHELFGFVRNIFFGANALALVGYEVYPMAPPRLTPAAHMIDTLYGFLGANGKMGGSQLGYDEFAAMPSLHMAWALIVGITLALTLRPLALRLLAPLYPVVMLVAVVVTANHYLMDAVGAAMAVAMAAVLALALRWWQTGRGGLPGTLRGLWTLRYGAPAPHDAPRGIASGRPGPVQAAA
jgi:hypothetical protein